MTKAKGFSLIELLIVVAILLIIAAIAIPNLLRARIAANESSAAASLRTISTANTAYASAYGIGYAGDLNHLGPPVGGVPDSTHADMLDAGISGCPLACTSNFATKAGYNFTYAAPDPAPTAANPNYTFTVVAVPVTFDSTGNSTFCVDQTGVILRDIAGAGAAMTTASGNGCIQDGWVGATITPIQ
ncbi:MAG: prepilin-type N-terminal cleavage/methylation domain-containing protein [Acidobacteria bacterium]|nr:prepilin-type N-terminal cleavage/methylation domain-containing protein [Acidobacteriota bacterium]